MAEEPTSLKDPATAPRRALVVLGMHRSGTSAMSRVLALSGAQLPRTLLPPAADNPTGFWESSRIVSVNDEALRAVDLRWDDVFAARPQTFLSNFDTYFAGKAAEALAAEFDARDPIVLKDPRTSLLLSVWNRVFDAAGFEPTYIICVRNPLEVANSLMERKGSSLINFSVQKAILLWTNYLLAAERDTRGKRRVFTSYPDLLEDWRRQIGRIEAAAGFPMPRKTDASAIDIDGFLSESLRHHETSDEQFLRRAEIPDFVKATYQWMLAASRDQEGAPDVLDQASVELGRVESVVGGVLTSAVQQIEAQALEISGLRSFNADVAALTAERDGLRQERDRSIQRLTAVESSLTNLAGVNDRLLIRIEELEGHEAALPERDAEISRLNAVLAENAAHRDDLDRRLHETAGRVSELDAAVHERDLRIAELSRQILERDEQALDFQRQLQERDAQAEAYREMLRGHEEREVAQSTELARVAADLSAARAEATANQARLDAAQAQLAHADVEAKRYREEVDQLDEALIEGRAREAALRQSLSESDSLARETRHRAEQAEHAVASLRTSMTSLAAELQERQNDIDRIHRDLNAARQDIEHRTQSAAEHQAEYEALRAQRDAILASTTWRLSAPLRAMLSRGRRG